MTKPSDFSPSEAIELKRAGENQKLGKSIWALRLAGLVLMAAGWLAVSLSPLDSLRLPVNTTVFALLAAYAFLAAAFSRRIAVNLERKLRLGLLVHNMELENMAMRDEITQLFNRRYLFDRLERELQTARGFERPFAIIKVNLDCLKAVNDTRGFQAGDRLLANFGQFLLTYTRASDLPARTGGKEFIIILPDTTKRGACAMVERLEEGIEKADFVDDELASITLGASFGISGYPWGGDSVDAILKHAEETRSEDLSADAEPAGDGNGAAAHATPVPAVFRNAGEAETGGEGGEPAA